jgi:metal-responsive CopG/Arc/MetJ family transcriptional regulator
MSKTVRVEMRISTEMLEKVDALRKEYGATRTGLFEGMVDYYYEVYSGEQPAPQLTSEQLFKMANCLE